MENLSLSDHFNNLISGIKHRITNGSIDDKIYDDWIIKEKKSIINKLKNEYTGLHAFYNNPEMMLPKIIVNSYFKIYTTHFDQRMNSEKLQKYLEEFIKIELGFLRNNVNLIDVFFSITIWFNEDEATHLYSKSIERK